MKGGQTINGTQKPSYDCNKGEYQQSGYLTTIASLAKIEIFG